MINIISDGLGAIRRKKPRLSWSVVLLLICGFALVAAKTSAMNRTGFTGNRLLSGSTLSALTGGFRLPSSVQNFYLNNYAISNTVNNYLQGATISGGSSVGTVTNNIASRWR
jgi:hypothetical protein